MNKTKNLTRVEGEGGGEGGKVRHDKRPIGKVGTRVGVRRLGESGRSSPARIHQKDGEC
jgi:hypothetical protein